MDPALHATTPLPAPAPAPWTPLPALPGQPALHSPTAPAWAEPIGGPCAGPRAAVPATTGGRARSLTACGRQALALGALALLAGFAPAPPLVAETLVATRTIRPATLIGLADVALVPETHPGALSDPDAVLGKEARVALYPGRPIRPGDVGPAAVVERNGIVPLIYRRGGLIIHAEGRALGRGAPGETVRVMNLSSRSTVSGVIGADGTVHVAGSTRHAP